MDHKPWIINDHKPWIIKDHNPWIINRENIQLQEPSCLDVVATLSEWEVFYAADIAAISPHGYDMNSYSMKALRVLNPDIYFV